MKAEQPATTYPDFKNEIINETARRLNIPFNVAACNSSDYNYASGRLDHQTYFKSIRVERSELEAVALDRILYAWLAEARASEAWNHTSAVLAMIANASRDPKKSRPLKPGDFHPYAGKRKRGIPVTAANIQVLKRLAEGSPAR